jgi:hypothetical protein
VSAPNEDEREDSKTEHVFSQFPTHHIIIMFGDFNASEDEKSFLI